MIDLILVAFACVAVTGTVAIVSYEFGRRSRGSVVAIFSDTALAQVRFDADCSRVDALKFLDRARDAVTHGELLSHSEANQEVMLP